MTAVVLTALGVGALAWLMWPSTAAAAGKPTPPAEPEPKPEPEPETGDSLIDVDVSIAGLNLEVDSGPTTPALSDGVDADHPAWYPRADSYYAVQSGDTGVSICVRAYGLELGQGAPLRAWQRVVADPHNRILGADGQPWRGGLYARYAWPGQHPFGSGSRYPIVYLPPAEEVV